MTTAMAGGYTTETAAAMVDSNRNGNGRRQQQWETATAMAMELATRTEMAMAIAMAMATARVTMTKAGLPLHVPAMCSAMAGVTPSSEMVLCPILWGINLSHIYAREVR
jgi:hypothetical protein